MTVNKGLSISLRTTILPQFTTVDKIIQTFSFLGKLIVTTINTMQEGNVTTWTTIKMTGCYSNTVSGYSYFRELVRTMQRIHKPSIIPLTVPIMQRACANNCLLSTFQLLCTYLLSRASRWVHTNWHTVATIQVSR